MKIDSVLILKIVSCVEKNVSLWNWLKVGCLQKLFKNWVNVRIRDFCKKVNKRFCFFFCENRLFLQKKNLVSKWPKQIDSFFDEQNIWEKKCQVEKK